MTAGYVFTAGRQIAISKEADGGNLPAPKVGTWQFSKQVGDVNQPGLIGFDPALFAKQGYQVFGAKPEEGILADQNVLADKNVLE